MTTNLTDQNFQEEMEKSEKPVLVDFYASWCGPCQVLGPILEKIADEFKDKIILAKVNVDDNPNTAASHGIRSIPTIMLFKDGKLQDTLVGLVPKDRLEAFVKKVL